ncbi:MAG: hypothetical protein K6D59_08535 [Bacteroidales bacterium]|nr:hypothetical protein [Bacteroidales bacterium]
MLHIYTKNSFLFTGKERDRETGYGYFGARYMDYELLTSFISVDRYASKYPFISPYAYCAWNPIKLMDPTGDTIIFNDKKVEKMFDDVYNDVSCRMFKLKNRGFKKESRREEYEALSKIKQSMDDVRNSKTKFYYSSLPNPDGSIKSGGHTYGKKGVDGIIVEITTGCFGTLVHETKHASQYISGDWELDMASIDEYGHWGLINYDLQDEFDAYRQENDYQFYINREEYYDEDRIKTDFVNGYKENPSIIPEYIQYNASNPYLKK